MKNWRDYIFPTLVALCALSVSGSAAFYSVTGLSKLFAGASLQVIIMAGSLEVSKLVIASLLYRYWKELNAALKYYLTVAAGILVFITSIGIYGFLSAAYQETANKAGVLDTRIAFLEQKRDFYLDDVSRYDLELERISQNINTLSQAKSRDIQIRDTTSVTGFRSTISTTELRLAQSRIDTEESNRKEVQAKRAVAADSLQKYQVQILEANVGNDLAAELGPLKYISGLTGWPMDQIVNILLLTIIFVFDPLAISLVIAANFAFLQISNKKELDLYKPEIVIDTDSEEKEEPRSSFIEKWSKLEQESRELPDEEDDKTQEELWENSLEDGLDDLDWKIVDDEPIEEDVEEKEEPQPKPKKIVRILQRTPSKRRVQFDDGTEGWVNKGEENTIIYM